MAEKRAKKAAEEAKEAKANELIRRKAGKVRTRSVNLFPDSRQRCAHTIYRTGSRGDQGGYEEQTDPEEPRGKAPRFVLSSPFYPTPSHKAPTRPFQKRRTTSVPAPQSRPRSKPTGASARKKQRKKRRSARVPPSPPRCPQHRQGRQLPPPQRRLRSLVVSSRRRGCRSGSRAVVSR